MEGTCKAGVVLLNFHEQLISGIYLGKGLLVVLMFLELGPVYRSFMLPFFNFFFFCGECIVYIVGQSGGHMEELGFLPRYGQHTVLDESLSLCSQVTLNA